MAERKKNIPTKKQPEKLKIPFEIFERELVKKVGGFAKKGGSESPPTTR